MHKRWTGNLVGLMHDNKITNNQLAEHMGLSYQYVNMVLNKKRDPSNAKERFEKAVSELITKSKLKLGGANEPNLESNIPAGSRSHPGKRDSYH